MSQLARLSYTRFDLYPRPTEITTRPRQKEGSTLRRIDEIRWEAVPLFLSTFSVLEIEKWVLHLFFVVEIIFECFINFRILTRNTTVSKNVIQDKN